MNEKQYGAWLMDLANYLINTQGYQMATISKKTDEVWLINPKHKLAPVVMISTMATQDFDDAMIVKQRETLALIFQTSPLGVNISVNPDSNRLDAMNVNVTPNFKSPSDVLEGYLNIEKVLKYAKNADFMLARSVMNLKKTLAKKQQGLGKPLYATWALSILVALFFAISLFFTKDLGDNPLVYVMMGAFYKPLVAQGYEMWRFVTSAFVSIDVFELLLSLLILRNAGRLIETKMGWKQFLGIFLLGTFVGNLMLYITQDAVLNFGIAHGICALVGALFVFTLDYKAYRSSGFMSQVISLTIITALYATTSTVSLEGMFGALFVGVLCGFLQSSRKDWQIVRQGLKIALPLFIVALIGVAMTRPYYSNQPDVIQALVAIFRRYHWDGYANHLQNLFH